MLTVAEALQMEQFAGAQIVAGQHGQSRPVAWVHVASVPDAPQWLNGGELVLTTSINMPEGERDQIAYVQAMADKGVAALAIAVGRYIDRIPDALRAVAERNHFPLIEIPYQARFVDVARAANQRISNEHASSIERALHVHQVLTQLVLDGGDLKDLARTMADLIGQSISIENERFEALASHNIADVDEARRYTLSAGRTDPRLIDALEARGILPQIRATRRPVHIEQMPDVGLGLERILAPIVVHGDVYGYLWIIADDRPLSDLDRMAIESGATIAALMLFYQEAIQSAEASLKGGLLSQLIQYEADGREKVRDIVLADQALRYGLDLNAPYVMLLLEPAVVQLNDLRPNERGAQVGAQAGQAGSQKLLQLYRRVDRLSSLGNWRAVVGQFAGQVVVLAQKDASIDTIMESIHTSANGNGAGSALRIGVSGTQRGVGRVNAAHSQCRDTLHIVQRLGGANGARTIYFDDLGYLHALYRAGAESLHSNPYAEVLRALLDEHQADLFHTLEVYLDEGGNGVQTAEKLCIHRSTLNYRLERIESICHVQLSDPLLRTNLQVALKLLRLFEVE